MRFGTGRGYYNSVNLGVGEEVFLRKQETGSYQTSPGSQISVPALSF